MGEVIDAAGKTEVGAPGMPGVVDAVVAKVADLGKEVTEEGGDDGAGEGCLICLQPATVAI